MKANVIMNPENKYKYIYTAITVHKKSYEDIAEELGLNVTTIKEIYKIETGRLSLMKRTKEINDLFGDDARIMSLLLRRVLS